MGVDLTVKPVESALRINKVIIELCRDNADVTVVLDVLSDSGGVIRQESWRHPGPISFIKEFIPAPKDVFDQLDQALATLSGFYCGITTPNSDITL